MIAKALKFEGRVLHLTEDQELLKQQLSGALTLTYDEKRKLIDNISTDELTPGWVCYYYDETLARYCLVGLRGGMQSAARKVAGEERSAAAPSSRWKAWVSNALTVLLALVAAAMLLRRCGVVHF